MFLLSQTKYKEEKHFNVSFNFRWDSFPLFQILNDYLRTDGKKTENML